MFELGVQLQTGNIAKGFEEVVNRARNDLIKAMKENIDSRAKGSWVEDGGVLSGSGKADKFIISDVNHGPKQFVSVLQELYVKAFEDRYRAVQEAHRAKAPQPAGKQWVDAKKEGSGPSPWNSKSIGQFGQVDYALMTGWLRESILEVIRGENTNKYFEFDNPMLRGAWRHNIENYEYKGFNYVQKITEYFVNELGILDDKYDLTDLPGHEINKIGNRMLEFLEEGFSKDFLKRIEEMDIEITPNTS